MGKKWLKNERDVMDELGLRATVRSGAGWLDKEDGASELNEGDFAEIIAQLKSTEGKGIKIDRAIINELIYHAQMSHRKPVLILDYIDDYKLICVRPEDLIEVTKTFAKLWRRKKKNGKK